jgi:shikimate kinase
MNIVLIGYRGTGKSHVGRLLAAKLSFPYVSIDKAIVSRAGMSISEIVSQFGWQGFRDRESLEVREISVWDSIVIDTGGGVVERPENIEALRENGCLIWLKASVPTIVSRIEGGIDRPALTDGKSFTEEVAEVLERRIPLYRKAAMHEIDTDGLAPEEIAGQIVMLWQKRSCRVL